MHVDSQGYTPLLNGTRCVRRIIRAFVRAPAAMATLDASCTSGVPPVHTPGAYPVRLAQAAAATLVSGSDPGAGPRRAATVAAGALADATVRRFYSGGARGPGLRGGTFRARGEGPFASACAGSGSCATRPWTAGPRGGPRPGPPRGTLSVRLPGGARVRVSVSWNQRSRFARARMGPPNSHFRLPRSLSPYGVGQSDDLLRTQDARTESRLTPRAQEVPSNAG